MKVFGRSRNEEAEKSEDVIKKRRIEDVNGNKRYQKGKELFERQTGRKREKKKEKKESFFRILQSEILDFFFLKIIQSWIPLKCGLSFEHLKSL